MEPDDVVRCPACSTSSALWAAATSLDRPVSRTSRWRPSPTPAFAEGETRDFFATLRERRRPRPPPVRLVRHERAALHRAGRRRSERAGHQDDALPHRRATPPSSTRSSRPPRRASRSRSRWSSRRASTRRPTSSGPARWSSRGARRLRAGRPQDPLQDGARGPPRGGRACAATATSAPATTTPRRRGSTRTSACSPPTRDRRRPHRAVQHAHRLLAAAQLPQLLVAPHGIRAGLIERIRRRGRGTPRGPAGRHRDQDERAGRRPVIDALYGPARPASRST